MSRRPVGQPGRRLKRVPFLHGVPVDLTADDKAMVLAIVDAAADAMRQYARRTYPGVGGGMSISLTAGMLEFEARVWASRVGPSSYEDGVPDRSPFVVPQIGRA